MTTEFKYALFALPLAAAAALCSPAAHAQIGFATGPQIAIGHRGAPAYAPEHTFYSYDLAMQMGVDMLECDVFLTQDEVPVCIHDSTVDRTSDGSGAVQDMTLAQLRELDFGSWFGAEFAGARIVPFEEQLDCYLAHNPKMRFHVETKDSAEGRAEQVLVELLTRKGLIDTGGDIRTSTIVIQSFDTGSLERIRSLTPTLPTAFLFTVPVDPNHPDNVDVPTWVALGDGPDYIDAFAPVSYALMADPAMVQRFHANGHDVHAWTVDTAEEIDYLLGIGVDGIFSNAADILRGEIDAMGTGTMPEERGNPAEFERGCPGIAGRVTSNLGPGDIWAPNPDDRGVMLVASASDTPARTRALTAPVAGGGLGLGTLLLTSLGLLAQRRRSWRS